MNPEHILDTCLCKALESQGISFISDTKIRDNIEYVIAFPGNRSPARMVLSCLLAKLTDPGLDPRKPYTEIGDKDCFSGRSFDEQYITHFITKYSLPLNHTTAFLTPAFRTQKEILTCDRELIGRPKELYRKSIDLLDTVAQGSVNPELMMIECIRILLLLKNEKQTRIESAIRELKRAEKTSSLPAASILTLISQHLLCRNSSRLPVLVVSAIYQVAGSMINEKLLPPKHHNAADLQTGAIGDLEIQLISLDKVVTAYEMKTRRITVDDIDLALEKLLYVTIHYKTISL
jgi:hypothetical protein